MSRAKQISEDIKRQTGRTWYHCLNKSCGNVEMSSDMTPTDMLRGHGPACAGCGSKTEAIASHTTLPGHVITAGPHNRRNLSTGMA